MTKLDLVVVQVRRDGLGRGFCDLDCLFKGLRYVVRVKVGEVAVVWMSLCLSV